MEIYIKMLEKTKRKINKEMIVIEKENSDPTSNIKYAELGKLLEDISKLQFKFMKRGKKWL